MKWYAIKTVSLLVLFGLLASVASAGFYHTRRDVSINV